MISLIQCFEADFLWNTLLDLWLWTYSVGHIMQLLTKASHNPKFFVLKMFSAFYICCINSNALQTTFESPMQNTMNPDQTAPREVSRFGVDLSILGVLDLIGLVSLVLPK